MSKLLTTNVYSRDYFSPVIASNAHTTQKLVYCSPYIWKKIFLFNQSFVFKGTERKIYNRSSVVPNAFVNLPVHIYSGKRWHIRLINQWMVGYKFGEFTWNRKLALYKAKQLKKLKKKKLK